MPTSRDLEWGDELPFVAANSAHFSPYPLELLTDREIREWRKELRDRQAKRKQPGFTAEWDEDGKAGR